MTYAEILDTFAKTLKRRDCPASLLNTWVSQSIQRAQRLLTVPAADTSVTYSVGPDFDGLPIPNDYLKLISLTVDGRELKRSDLTTVNALSQHLGSPIYFVRQGAMFLIGPRPSDVMSISINYMQNFAALENPDDSNWLTDIANDVIIAGAMVSACRYFADQRMPMFEEEFTKGIADLNNQADRDELSNAQVLGSYSFAFDEHD